MSELRLGGLLVDTIGQLKVGSSNVTAAYVGSVKVFPASTTTTTSTTSTTTTTLIPTTTTTSTTTSTTTAAPTTTTSTTTSTTTAAPTTTTSTTTSTTTAAPTVYSYSIWTLSDSTPPYDGADSHTNACTFLTPSSLGLELTVYSTSATFQNGMTLFTDISLSTAFVAAAAPNNYFRYDTNSFRYSSSVTELTACPATTTTTTSTTTSTTTEAPTTTTTSTTTSTTTEAPTTTTTSTTTSTTTLAYVTFNLAYSTVSGPEACNNYPTIDTTTYYATVGSTLTTGTIIYVDSNLTTPAPNGFYSNGVNYWNTGAIPGAGNLQNETSCGSTTTTTTSTTTTTTTSAPSSVTIFWNTSEIGSGGVRLVIYDSTSTPIVDEESSGAGPTNGSVTTSNTPFTVAVSRIAGTEVAQYRICNDSTSTEITHNYSVTSEVTYVVDPTPLTTTIFATYGDSNTPSNCSVE